VNNRGRAAPEPEQVDFRSSRFRDLACALARMTGCALESCRQELFIAEGDAVEAYQVLVQGRPVGPPDQHLH